MIRKNTALSLLVLGSLAFLIVSVVKGLIGPQYYILIMPFIALLISLKFDKIEKTIKNVKLHSLIIILFIIFGFIVPLGAMTFDLSRTDLNQEKAELNYFLSFKNHSQPSLDEGWLIFHEDTNFASFTQNVFMNELVKLNIAKNESYSQQIETYKPLFIRTVFLEYQIDEIQPYLDRDYNKTKFDGVWVRKD
ncbi:MAG: hypothetical protein NT076_02575 [Candidatus Pacearchaeota archaeon]|nr:hypothetical protein [Candidatus Pacearchaeota archaeon]